MNEHKPVLLAEAVQALNIQTDGLYVDATFGRGGHTRAVLGYLGEKGRILAIDRDPDAVTSGREQFVNDHRVTVVHAHFSSLAKVLADHDISHGVTGVIMDLGLSSPQLDQADRGFSFSHDGPLDMRMDPQSGQSASEWLATVEEQDLITVLKTLGEERFARRIAHAIVTHRQVEKIVTTAQLAGLVSQAIPKWESHKHPATRSFQAIRLHINRELGELETILPQALDCLACGGRLVVISFHSLEDRIVKRFMRSAAKGDDFPPDLPISAAQLCPVIRLIGKAVRPTDNEVRKNPRSRSAVMRVAEKL